MSTVLTILVVTIIILVVHIYFYGNHDHDTVHLQRQDLIVFSLVRENGDQWTHSLDLALAHGLNSGMSDVLQCRDIERSLRLLEGAGLIESRDGPTEPKNSASSRRLYRMVQAKPKP